jgi:hypothetical protein
MQQITIRFDAGLVESYPTLKELLAARVHQQGRPQKAIAADLDMSPTDLSRKLTPNENDAHRNFDVNKMVEFIEKTGDKTAVDWLVEKFYGTSEIDALRAKVAEYEAAQDRLKGVA